MKKLMIAALVVTFPVALFAQSGTKSPYSQFGLGALAEQTSGFNKGMNGIGYGLREHNQVNYLNPASYSALDSLTVSKTDSVYIGDSDVDFMTAKNSGLSFIGCSWGFKGRSFLEKLGAGTIVDNAEQLVQEILKQEK